MRPRGGGRGEHLLAALTRLYGTLLVLYPEAFLRRYQEEMLRDFRELMREGLEEGGAKELVRVWAEAHSDLVLTALKERGTKFLRNAYLPVAPGTAARWGALSALLGGSLGVALNLANTLTIFVQLDRLLGGRGWVFGPVLSVFIFATLLSVLGMFGLYGKLVARSGRPDALALSGVILAALSAVSLLALLYACATAEMLGWLWTPGEGTSWWWEMYRTGLLQEIGMGACVLGLLLLGASAFRARLFGRLRALPLVVAPLWPASVGLLLLSNMFGMMGYIGYLASLSATLPFFGAALSGWVMLNYHPTERPTAAGGAPESVSDVGSNEFTSGERARDVPYRLQRQWTVPRARAGWRAMVAAVLVGPSRAYVIKEKELLEALVWHGKLTAVEAALESSLSVREAELILQALVAKGHLEVTVEHGRLHYAPWERDTPLFML